MAWQSYPWWEQTEGERQYRTFDPERGLEIMKGNQPVGFTGYASMKITGPDLNFSFYIKSYREPNDPNVLITLVDTGGLLDDIASSWIRPLITEGLEAFGILYGFRPSSIKFKKQFLDSKGEIN